MVRGERSCCNPDAAGSKRGWSVHQNPVLPQVVNMQGTSSWAAWRYRCAPHALPLHVRGLT